jgi:hypothetical protein
MTYSRLQSILSDIWVPICIRILSACLEVITAFHAEAQKATFGKKKPFLMFDLLGGAYGLFRGPRMSCWPGWS